MKSWEHIVIASCGLLGLLIGSLAVDLDHRGLSLKNAKDCLLSLKSCKVTKGVLHKPIIAFSIILFLYSLATAYVIHLIVDAQIKW
jgi:hypothetical protein